MSEKEIEIKVTKQIAKELGIELPPPLTPDDYLDQTGAQ